MTPKPKMTEEERKERRREQQRAWRAANPERARAQGQAWRAANPERARAQWRAWRAANSERVRAQGQAWRAANPERVRERDRAWRAANPERVRAQGQAWRAANPERVRAQGQAWRAANPERAREHGRQGSQNRRARLCGAIDPCRRVTSATTARREALFGNVCCFCGASGRLTLEHVVALANGGLHVPTNLAPACGRCNSSKCATPVESWYPRQPFFDPERWEFLQAHTGNRWAVAEQLSLPIPTPAATP